MYNNQCIYENIFLGYFTHCLICIRKMIFRVLASTYSRIEYKVYVNLGGGKLETDYAMRRHIALATVQVSGHCLAIARTMEN